MNQEILAHVYDRLLFIYEKEWNLVICSNMNGLEDITLSEIS